MKEPLPEVWLRGPIAGVPAALQPVAHALLQVIEEVQLLMAPFPDRLLWKRPAGLASAGFHLLHLAGVLDRLCTYARGLPLNAEQRHYLQGETVVQNATVAQLVAGVERAVANTIEQLKATPETSLAEHRPVGGKALPSTVGGLLAHAAEHSMRHLGQLLVTVKVLLHGEMGATG